MLGYGFTAKFNFVMFGFAYLVSLSALRGLWLWSVIDLLLNKRGNKLFAY